MSSEYPMDPNWDASPLEARIETERLVVRRYEPRDAAWFHTMGHRNRAHLARYEADNFVRGIRSPEEAAVIIQDLIEAWNERSSLFFGAFVKGPDGSEGPFALQIYVGLVDQALPAVEVGYFADIDHEGRGYVTEAVSAVLGWIFAQLGAHRIQLACDDTNHRSAAVAERCGFVREAHLRENKRNADGSLSGTFIYGLLRQEYEAAGHVTRAVR